MHKAINKSENINLNLNYTEINLNKVTKRNICMKSLDTYTNLINKILVLHKNYLNKYYEIRLNIFQCANIKNIQMNV